MGIISILQYINAFNLNLINGTDGIIFISAIAVSTLLTNIIVSVDITIINTIFASNFRWIFYPKNSSHSKLHFITTVTTIKN